MECIFTWYWLADVCAPEGIVFVLGHALYRKAIHGGKAKNDRIDALKIATRLHAAPAVAAHAEAFEFDLLPELIAARWSLG